VRQYHEANWLWPMMSFARGEGKTTTRVWPLGGVSHNDVMERNFYLWPVYKYSHIQSAPLDRSRTQILFFLYSDVRESNTVTSAASRRVDCWPLFTHSRDREGNSRLQVLSIIEPVLSKSKSIDRNYSPLWSVWRSEHSPSNASSQSLLWNLYRHQESPGGSKRTSFLFGLFQHETTPRGSGLRILYLPFKKAPKADTAVVDSKVGLEQPAAGVRP